jgi:hypothetical protein
MRPRFEVSDMNSLIRAITRGSSAVALPIGVTKSPVAFVDNHDHLANGFDHVKNFSRLPSVAPTHLGESSLV